MNHYPSPNTTRHFRFGFRIRHVREDLPRNLSPRTNPPEHYWKPPLRATWFRIDDVSYHLDRDVISPDDCVVWEGPGRMRKMKEFDEQYYRPYKTTSLFWCHDRHGYLVLPYNCTERDGEDEIGRIEQDMNVGGASEVQPWRRLCFSYNGQNVALVKHQGGTYRLRNTSQPSFIPSLLPTPCQGTSKETQEPVSHLAGELSILIGLVAFCESPELALHAIATAFRPAPYSCEWQWNGHVDRGTENRGMIIEIFKHLQWPLDAWEGGHYGGIFTSHNPNSSIVRFH